MACVIHQGPVLVSGWLGVASTRATAALQEPATAGLRGSGTPACGILVSGVHDWPRFLAQGQRGLWWCSPRFGVKQGGRAGLWCRWRAAAHDEARRRGRHRGTPGVWNSRSGPCGFCGGAVGVRSDYGTPEGRNRGGRQTYLRRCSREIPARVRTGVGAACSGRCLGARRNCCAALVGLGGGRAA